MGFDSPNVLRKKCFLRDRWAWEALTELFNDANCVASLKTEKPHMTPHPHTCGWCRCCQSSLASKRKQRLWSSGSERKATAWGQGILKILNSMKGYHELTIPFCSLHWRPQQWRGPCQRMQDTQDHLKKKATTSDSSDQCGAKGGVVERREKG